MRETLRQGTKGSVVRELQTMLNAVGADINVDGDFGEITDGTVRDFQAWKNLVEDGIVGPKTWRALEDAIRVRQHMDRVAKADRLRASGEEAVARALALWDLDIYDPKRDDESANADYCKKKITDFIHEGCAWRHHEAYEGDGDFQWCLAFAWYCWPDIRDAIRTVYAASTYRVDRFGSYRSAFGEPNPMPTDMSHARLYMRCDEKTRVEDLPWKPRAGDFALVGKKPGYGTHGVLVEHFDEEHGLLYTIEGNAFGDGPNGEHQQGVVRQVRPFGAYAKKGEHIVRRVVRPGLDDLNP